MRAIAFEVFLLCSLAAGQDQQLATLTKTLIPLSR